MFGHGAPKEWTFKKKGQPYVALAAWVFKYHVWHSLSPSEKAIYAVLAANAHNITRITMATAGKIAQMSGVHLKSVARVTARLHELGLIKKWRKGRRVCYWIIFDVPDKIVETSGVADVQCKMPKRSVSCPREMSTGRFFSFQEE